MTSEPKKIGELKPLVLDCPCGERATHAVVFVVRVAGKDVQRSTPACEEHVGTAAITAARGAVLPTHEHVFVRRAKDFPPQKTEIHAAPLMVCCPRCSGMASLDPDAFTLSERGLDPSFVCPQCGLHAWLRFEETCREGTAK
jgi:hypothetical protein